MLALSSCVFVGASPLSVPTDALLDQDDLIGDGFVPLYLQLHVMVVLKNSRTVENSVSWEEPIVLEPHQPNGKLPSFYP